MAVAITCGYGGYLLPLLAAHSSFDYGIAGIFTSYRNKLSSITRSQDNSHLISPILHYEFSQLIASSLTYSLLFSYQCCITCVVLFWKVYMSGEAV